MNTLAVIFKKDKGEVFAVFPYMKWDDDNITCYAHIGQHSACSWNYPYGLKNARPSEYAELLKEIKGIYDDRIVEVLRKMPKKEKIWRVLSI